MEVYMKFMKAILIGLILAGLVACGGDGGGSFIQAADDTTATYDGTSVVTVSTGSDGKVLVTSRLSDTSYDILLKDDSGNPLSDAEVSFYEVGGNAVIYVSSPLGTYSDVILVGTAAELASAFGRPDEAADNVALGVTMTPRATAELASAFGRVDEAADNIALGITMTARVASTVGFTSDAYDLVNVYMGDTRTGTGWTTGCYTPAEIAAQMQTMYQTGMADSDSILCFDGAGADTSLKFLKYASSQMQSGIGSAIAERLEGVFGASPGAFEGEYFQLDCYTPESFDVFGTMCEVVRGASACDSYNITNTAPAISGTPLATVTVDTAYSFVPTALDTDDDTLTFSITSKPDWSSFDTLTGALTGKPVRADIGLYRGIVISVSDGTESVSLSSFSIDVPAPSVVQPTLILKTGQTTSYVANDDGDYQYGLARSYTRDDTNEIVTDNVTGLEWQDNAVVATVQRTWSEAVAYCDGLSMGGHDDWRLPTIRELKTIVDYGKYDSSIDSAFQNTVTDPSIANLYYSSTLSPLNPANVKGINFEYGYSPVVGGVTCVRCVR